MAAGARIRAAFHPILDLDGVKTSVIALVCDTLAGEAREKAVQSLREAFAQGALAVRDWKAMLARLTAARDDLARHPPRIAGQPADIGESLAFLDWLADNHFTLLGARDYVLSKDGANGMLEPVKGSSLGVLCDEDARVIRKGGERTGLTAEVRAFLDTPDPIIVTKSATRSVVHRRAHMDYIGIKTFDPNGAFAGERRFVGLFTSNSYFAPARSIPLLRKKIEAVMGKLAGFSLQEQQVLALLVRAHRRKWPKAAFEELPPERQSLARSLAVLLRLATLLPPDLRSRINDLRTGDLLALRFCADEELAEVTRRVLAGELKGRDAIKRAIRTWRPDHRRL